MSVSARCPAATEVRSGRFSLCGVGIEVNTTDPEVAALIGSRLRVHRSHAHSAPSVVFDIRGEDSGDFAVAPCGPARAVYDAPGGQVMYFGESDQLFVDYADSLRVLCDPSTGSVHTVICKQVPGRVLAAHPFFTIPLLELMKRQNRYPLHAACLALEGRGVLLAGSSGSGKSTLSVALVRAGWDFLSDDMVFLDRRGGETRAWGFSDEIDVSDQTAAMFPELRHLVGKVGLPGRGKHPLDVETAFGVVPVPLCRPAALVLPAVSGERRSELTPISAAVALQALAPNVLLTQTAAAQSHLDALAELARETPCFSLSTGTDFGGAADCLLGALG